MQIISGIGETDRKTDMQADRQTIRLQKLRYIQCKKQRNPNMTDRILLCKLYLLLAFNIADRKKKKNIESEKISYLFE